MPIKALSVAARNRVRIDAQLEDFRVLSERSQVLDTQQRREGEPLRMQATTNSNVGIGVFERTADAARLLIVNFSFKASLQSEDGKQPLCEYEAEFRGTFRIVSDEGLVPGMPTPVSAVATYLNQIGWMARARAHNTLSAMGFAGVALPLATTWNEPDSPAVVASSPVRRKRTSTNTKKR